jgi:membrane protease YdiL (CAAX protease family)
MSSKQRNLAQYWNNIINNLDCETMSTKRPSAKPARESKLGKPKARKMSPVEQKQWKHVGGNELEDHPLVALAPLDIISIIICFVAIFALAYERLNFYGSSEWLTLYADATTVLTYGVIGLIGVLSIRGAMGLFLKYRGISEMVPRGLISFSYTKNTFVYMVYAIASYFGIELIVYILKGAGLFQVAAGDVFVVFLSSAICEEIFFRGLLVMGIQLVLALLVYGWQGIFNQYGEKRHLRMIDVVTIILSALIFTGVHSNYWNDPELLLMTLAGGMFQTYWYIRSNCLLVVFGSHVAVNFRASATLVQQMSGGS